MKEEHLLIASSLLKYLLDHSGEAMSAESCRMRDCVGEAIERLQCGFLTESPGLPPVFDEALEGLEFCLNGLADPEDMPELAVCIGGSLRDVEDLDAARRCFKNYVGLGGYTESTLERKDGRIYCDGIHAGNLSLTGEYYPVFNSPSFLR